MDIGARVPYKAHDRIHPPHHATLTNNKRLTFTTFHSSLCDGPSFLPVGKTRYSYLLTLLFVGMAYSGGMFAINALSFFFFMLTYWVDKAMLLRFYKRPPHREDALQRQVSLISSSRLIDCPYDHPYRKRLPSLLNGIVLLLCSRLPNLTIAMYCSCTPL